MSSYLYARLSNDRVRALSKVQFNELPQDQREAQPEPKKRYIDAFAALIPAEALALHAFVIELTTVTEKGPDGKDVTTITEPGVLRGSFWALLAVALIAYIAPRVTNGNLVGLDFVRMFVPPLAFVGWMLLQQPSAIQDVLFFADWGDVLKAVVAAFGAIALGLIAGLLAMQQDGQEANPEP